MSIAKRARRVLRSGFAAACVAVMFGSGLAENVSAAPQLEIVSPVNGSTQANPVLFRFESDGTSFDCILPALAPFACQPGVDILLAVPGGFHTITVMATGLGGTTINEVSFFVDTFAPVLDAGSIRKPAAATCPGSTEDSEIRWQLAEPDSSFPPSAPYGVFCTLNGNPSTDCRMLNAALGLGTFRWRCLADGNYELVVTPFDVFGNRGEPTAIGFSVARPADISGCPVNACAGPDQRVPQADVARLDGSLSVGQASVWTQIGGPAVSFDPSDIRASFTTPVLPSGTGSQVLTFKLDTLHVNGLDSDTVDITVSENRRPIADAGVDQAVKEGSSVQLSALASFDPDGAQLTYAWSQTGGAPVGLSNPAAAAPAFIAPTLDGGLGTPEVLAFDLAVSDGVFTSHVDQVRVLVEQINHAPVADAGVDQTKLQGTVVTLNGSASSDPDGDRLLYSWAQTEGPPVSLVNANTANPTFTAPMVPRGGAALGFRLTVSDTGLESADQVAIAVRQPNDPPVCSFARPSQTYLWPPTHRLIPVTILGVTDSDDAVSIAVTGVSQDEPVNGTGDGDTAPDAVIQDGTVLLRAERAGTGNGRVYQVSFTADDGAGGSCNGMVRVIVPASSKPGFVADDGAGFDSTLQ